MLQTTRSCFLNSRRSRKGEMKIKQVALGGLVAGLALTGVLSATPALVTAAESAVTTVTPADLEDNKLEAMSNGKWFIYNDENDTINNTLATFVVGPETPPLGEDSVQISVDGTERVNLATYRFSGTPLAEITELEYSTYNASAGNGGSANRSGYLQFNVDFNDTDTWQRRLVFLPTDNGTVIQDEWQAWDAIQDGEAKWRYSGPTWPGTAISGTTPRTWDDILASYPGVRVRVTDSFMGVRVGEPYADGYTENLDAFVFGTGAGSTAFDFELEPELTKEACKNGGWMSFVSMNFKNQGQCVSHVMTMNAPGKNK